MNGHKRLGESSMFNHINDLPTQQITTQQYNPPHLRNLRESRSWGIQAKQQYTPFYLHYQPYQQLTAYGNGAVHPWLTRLWQAGDNVPQPPPQEPIPSSTH